MSGFPAPGSSRRVPPSWSFRGNSDAARRVRTLVECAARVDATVLITGESGVGKELVAREIHSRSRRGDGAFVPINCAAIPDTLWESEMFGHEAGAFTDARASRRGVFELAHEGTLFLDEVGDLSSAAQPKFLRVLESAEIVRVGSEQARRVDVRILAATNHDLRAMSRAGAFRQDLYFRLRVFEIHVPPLRERREDIPDLVEAFAGAAARRFGREIAAVDPDALRLLQDHPWPGNVRELRSVVERAVAMTSAAILTPPHFLVDPATAPGLDLRALLDKDWKTARAEFESAYAARLVGRFGGNVPRAALAAGLVPRSLYKMLRRLGLRPAGGGDSGPGGMGG